MNVAIKLGGAKKKGPRTSNQTGIRNPPNPCSNLLIAMAMHPSGLQIRVRVSKEKCPYVVVCVCMSAYENFQSSNKV